MFSIVGISLFYSFYHDCYILKENDQFNLATNSFNNLLVVYEIKNDITSITKFCADKYNGIMDTEKSLEKLHLLFIVMISMVNKEIIENDKYGKRINPKGEKNRITN